MLNTKCAFAQILDVFRGRASCFGARRKRFEWFGKAGSWRGGRLVTHTNRKKTVFDIRKAYRNVYQLIRQSWFFVDAFARKLSEPR